MAEQNKLMIRSLILNCLIVFSLLSNANTIVVKNIDELNDANKKALPGDIIILQNGNWNEVTIVLNCIGTKEKPITVKAQTAGKVLITGNSKLKLGGKFIIVDGLYFSNGFAGKENVISFRIDNKQLANNCRVTNTAINNFNNPKRMDENNWVGFYGKNNRIDHCSFINKKNMGVLMAVLLDDERSRENFHSVDHNYFGWRLPLASNGGEIIRVGLSQHCQYNSNTIISNNFFEYCDGEAEIISIKSCANEVKENIFKECQGSVVLRHGDNNLVAGNYFLGNDKLQSGGVRVINKGQKVIDNIFYKCRGTDFRSPLVIMNGVPNSPPTRYVQVTNAQITGNTFYECSPLSFCEGSDTERSLPPQDVSFEKNTFYNTRDSTIYTAYDDITGINFGNNKVSTNISQELAKGFEKTIIRKQNILTEKEIAKSCGAPWFKKDMLPGNKKTLIVNCSTAEAIYKQLENKDPVIIRLSGMQYSFPKPILISKSVWFISNKSPLQFTSAVMPALFIISGNGNLTLNDLVISGEKVMATHFIESDSAGLSDHYSLSIHNSIIKDLGTTKGCIDIFHANRSMVADSIIIRNSQFINNACDFVNMADEKEDKGYYNAEKIIIGHNKFLDHSGSLLNIYRGGSDESTLGPDLVFSHNKIENCQSQGKNDPLISLTGVQVTEIFSNQFTNCNTGTSLILYKDIVRANHIFERNILQNSGKPETNKFVVEKQNITR